MRKLNETQIKFFIEHIFGHAENNGWDRIARTLILDGSCIVAGDRCIWKGGVGNFIEGTTADNVFGCVKYDFDLDSFMNTGWFDDRYKEHLKRLLIEVQRANHEYNEMCELIVTI